MDDNGKVLERLRVYCDNGIRYYTWALERVPFIPEQAEEVGQVRNLRAHLATVLAYIEGVTDERGAMVQRDEIVNRYVEAVREEGWEPPFATASP